MGASFSQQNSSSSSDPEFSDIYKNSKTNSNFSDNNSMRTNQQKYDCFNECKKKCQPVSMGGKRIKSRRRGNKRRKSSRRK